PAALRAHPTAATAGALIGLAAVSAGLRTIFALEVHGPFVFMDELGYARMAQSFAHTGRFSLFGKGGLAYSPLYPVVLSPIYALTSSAQTAYESAKVVNAVLMSLAAFPVYGIARSVLDRPRALGVAALSLAAPLMFYTAVEMSENLAYPLALSRRTGSCSRASRLRWSPGSSARFRTGARSRLRAGIRTSAARTRTHSVSSRSPSTTSPSSTSRSEWCRSSAR